MIDIPARHRTIVKALLAIAITLSVAFRRARSRPLATSRRGGPDAERQHRQSARSGTGRGSASSNGT